MDISAISSAGLSPGLVNGIDHAGTQNQALIAAWETWAGLAPDGAAEYRDKAVLLLKDCLERGAAYLNLNCLNLSSLPESLPPNLVQLKASGNAFTSLPANLPAGLHELDADNTPLASLPENLPPGLKSLYLNGTNLSAIPDDLPAELKALHLNNVPIDRLPANLPSGLLLLFAGGTNLSGLPANLSSTLTLYINNTPLASLIDRHLPGFLSPTGKFSVDALPAGMLPEWITGAIPGAGIIDGAAGAIPGAGIIDGAVGAIPGGESAAGAATAGLAGVITQSEALDLSNISLSRQASGEAATPLPADPEPVME
ncbi:hypothetical protein [Acerihabitans sp.]|uniref:hypothetical protein n=1 Tax=Acerihabitans sp. TaxID=2811394 RepID=UPI002ED78FA1